MKEDKTLYWSGSGDKKAGYGLYFGYDGGVIKAEIRGYLITGELDEDGCEILYTYPQVELIK
ncbi:hypothetical protein LCGC14_2525360 [marine sediment metagenome]|uniref:Uncharacterized protein n=1 Tax=marine sediment metagenome TaxID=412755 RepID=A0A0F9DND9_9ZZZZ|nr:hypothetical protein [Candidatus Aminicenantes bacterium]